MKWHLLVTEYVYVFQKLEYWMKIFFSYLKRHKNIAIFTKPMYLQLWCITSLFMPSETIFYSVSKWLKTFACDCVKSRSNFKCLSKSVYNFFKWEKYLFKCFFLHESKDIHTSLHFQDIARYNSKNYKKQLIIFPKHQQQ